LWFSFSIYSIEEIDNLEELFVSGVVVEIVIDIQLRFLMTINCRFNKPKYIEIRIQSKDQCITSIKIKI